MFSKELGTHLDVDVIQVLDTGVQVDHPRVVAQTAEIPSYLVLQLVVVQIVDVIILISV